MEDITISNVLLLPILRPNSMRNRRAIGFDKPTSSGQDGPTCEAASPESFGHTGFTGTIAWADPKYNLIYIFLCNQYIRVPKKIHL